jgi:hypothetical protein
VSDHLLSLSWPVRILRLETSVLTQVFLIVQGTEFCGLDETSVAVQVKAKFGASVSPSANWGQ